MKLSAAIEKALRTNRYNTNDEYMCHVLNSMGLGEHVEAVQDMVSGIAPSTRRGEPLSVALHVNPNSIFNFENMNWEEEFAFTQQFYCWWVFDLKNKGL